MRKARSVMSHLCPYYRGHCTVYCVHDLTRTRGQYSAMSCIACTCFAYLSPERNGSWLEAALWSSGFRGASCHCHNKWLPQCEEVPPATFSEFPWWFWCKCFPNFHVIILLLIPDIGTALQALFLPSLPILRLNVYHIETPSPVSRT